MEWEAKPKRNATTSPATQVGLRSVKAGLRGHDDGVSGVDEGVKNWSIWFWKLVRTVLSDCATFSRFMGVLNEIAYDTWKRFIETPLHPVLLIILTHIRLLTAKFCQKAGWRDWTTRLINIVCMVEMMSTRTRFEKNGWLLMRQALAVW